MFGGQVWGNTWGGVWVHVWGVALGDVLGNVWVNVWFDALSVDLRVNRINALMEIPLDGTNTDDS
jgi:hypothetical protein